MSLADKVRVIVVAGIGVQVEHCHAVGAAPRSLRCRHRS